MTPERGRKRFTCSSRPDAENSAWAAAAVATPCTLVPVPRSRRVKPRESRLTMSGWESAGLLVRVSCGSGSVPNACMKIW